MFPTIYIGGKQGGIPGRDSAIRRFHLAGAILAEKNPAADCFASRSGIVVQSLWRENVFEKHRETGTASSLLQETGETQKKNARRYAISRLSRDSLASQTTGFCLGKKGLLPARRGKGGGNPR